jgi:hypothetical protein
MDFTLRVRKDGDSFDVALIDLEKTGIDALLYTMSFKYEDFSLIERMVTLCSSYYNPKIDE